MRSPRGLTLIEVLASLALLGTLLVALVQARGDHLRQWTLAQRKLEAVDAAERLLEAWWADPATLPRSGSGTLDGGWRWRTQVREAPALEHEALHAELVRLEVLEAEGPKVLVTIDLFVPRPPEPPPAPSKEAAP